MKRRIQLVLVVLMVAAIAGLYMVNANQVHPFSTPPLLFITSFSQQYAGISSDILNASQGATQQLNLTLTSISPTPIAIPIENLTITIYSNSTDPNKSVSIDRDSAFNYSFNQNQLALRPSMSNSTVLTIKWADNAPAGIYTMEIHFGNVKFLPAPGPVDQTYESTTDFRITVTPKEM